LLFYYDELSDDINNKCPISYSSTIIPKEISSAHPESTIFNIILLIV
jgi:hypothetical protein